MSCVWDLRSICTVTPSAERCSARSITTNGHAATSTNRSHNLWDSSEYVPLQQLALFQATTLHCQAANSAADGLPCAHPAQHSPRRLRARAPSQPAANPCACKLLYTRWCQLAHIGRTGRARLPLATRYLSSALADASHHRHTDSQ
jgi:hypothetical protein